MTTWPVAWSSSSVRCGRKGIPAGTSETVDAAAVMEVLGLDRRELLREGLASALVRRGGQRDVFDMTFDLYFPAGTGTPQAVLDADDVGIDDLRDLLAMALADDDSRALEQVAEVAVDLLGEVGEGGPDRRLVGVPDARAAPSADVARAGAGGPRRWPGAARPEVSDTPGDGPAGARRDPAQHRPVPRHGGVRGPASHGRAARPRGRHPARRPPRQPTASTSSAPTASSSRSCAARCDRCRASSRPGSPLVVVAPSAGGSTSAAPCAAR